MESRRAEFVRLREALGDLGVPVDLIVLSAEYATKCAQVPGTMVNEAGEEAVSLSEREPKAEAMVLARKAQADATAAREFLDTEPIDRRAMVDLVEDFGEWRLPS